jgi:hypothetical protein
MKWAEMQLIPPQLSEEIQQQLAAFSLPKIRYEDESATVLMKVPKGHIEDAETATRHGFHKHFKRSGAGIVGIHNEASTISVTFHPRNQQASIEDPSSLREEETLESFLEKQRMLFFLEEPTGLVSFVHLSPTLTSHLQQNHLPFQVLIFNDCMDTLTRVFHHSLQLKTNTPRMSLFVQTPGGFWEFAYHSSPNNLINNKFQKECFADMVKNIKIVLKSESSSLIASTLSEDSSSLEQEKQTLPNQSAILGVGAKLTLRTATGLAKRKPVWEPKKRKRPSATSTMIDDSNTSSNSNSSTESNSS